MSFGSTINLKVKHWGPGEPGSQNSTPLQYSMVLSCIPDSGNSGVGVGVDPRSPANRGWDPHPHPRRNRGWGWGWGSGVLCPGRVPWGPLAGSLLKCLMNVKMRVLPHRGVACRPCVPQCAAQPRARFRLSCQKRGHGARAAARDIGVSRGTVVSKEAQEPKESGRIGRPSPLSPPKGPLFVACACERPGFRSSGAT